MADIGDILEVVASMVFGTSIQMQNVYHVRVESAGTSDDDVLEDMGEYLESIYSEVNSSFPNDLVYDEFSAKNLTIDFDFGLGAWPSLTQGAGADAYLPTQTSPYVNVRTYSPGHQGRKFFPPFTEGGWAEGGWISAVLTDLADAAAAAYTQFVSSNGHTYTPVIKEADSLSWNLPREIVIPALAGTQRRRRN